MTQTARQSASEIAELSDEQVVQRVLDGDAALFELLMRRHNQRVYRAVRGVLHDDSESEDVMQQAYINAYRNLAKFEHRASFATWLTRIAVYEAYNRIRKLRLVGNSVTEDEMVQIQTNSPDPEQEAISSDLHAVLEGAISNLPQHYRVVLILRDVEGSNTAEVAEVLDISEDVVKTRLHRARAMVREELLRKAGLSAKNLFTFQETRCNRVVDAVLEAIGVRS